MDVQKEILEYSNPSWISLLKRWLSGYMAKESENDSVSNK